MLELCAGDYRLVLEPEHGGSVAAFSWRGEALLRGNSGTSILDTACFPLVPFSNRIAFGRFCYDGQEVALSPNFPDSDHPHAIHGFGWLSKWQVADVTTTQVILEHRYVPGEWPWAYVARQRFSLEPEGLAIALSIENQSDRVMPAGLGFHPYFSRDDDTRYCGLHRGTWHNSDDCLPVRFDERQTAVDWFDGAPVDVRVFDTTFAGRDGPLHITWPSRNLSLTMQPTPNLGFTVVYTPRDCSFFCVEPVSHMSNALNWDRPDHGVCSLQPGAVMTAGMTITADRLL